MCIQTSRNEKRTLTLSALSALLFAVAGLVIGLLVDSLVIVFDGAYSLVSLVLTLLSLAAARFIAAPSCDRFTFGRAIFEPAVIAIKGAVILLEVVYSLYAAVEALLTGGREVDASVATAFGVVNVLGCIAVWALIAAQSKRQHSGLLDAEADQHVQQLVPRRRRRPGRAQQADGVDRHAQRQRRLRIDPGLNPGQYFIRSLEIRF